MENLKDLKRSETAHVALPGWSEIDVSRHMFPGSCSARVTSARKLFQEASSPDQMSSKVTEKAGLSTHIFFHVAVFSKVEKFGAIQVNSA